MNIKKMRTQKEVTRFCEENILCSMQGIADWNVENEINVSLSKIMKSSKNRCGIYFTSWSYQNKGIAVCFGDYQMRGDEPEILNDMNITELYFDSGVTQVRAGAAPEAEYIFLSENTVEICENAFLNNKSLKEIVMPEGLKVIGKSAFAGCASLYKFSIPSTVEVIDDNAFSDCIFTDRITLPEGLKRIGKYAFSGCQTLREIEIPSTVEVIEEGAFNDCYALRKITLHKGLKVIEKDAFSDYLPLIDQIELPSTTEQVYDDFFETFDVIKMYRQGKPFICTKNITHFGKHHHIQKRVPVKHEITDEIPQNYFKVSNPIVFNDEEVYMLYGEYIDDENRQRVDELYDEIDEKFKDKDKSGDFLNVIRQIREENPEAYLLNPDTLKAKKLSSEELAKFMAKDGL